MDAEISRLRIVAVSYTHLLAGREQLAAQGVPGRQVHKGVAGAASAGEV